MTDQDRGAYTPQTDAPLSFDARYSRGSGERPVPMTLIVSGVVLVVLIVAMVLFYRSGVRGSGQAPQVVGTPLAQTKGPPAGQPASAAPAAGLQVYKSEATPPTEMKPPATILAPAPEQPAPRPAPVTKPVEEAKLRPAQPQVQPRSQTADQSAAPVVAKPAKVIVKPATAPKTIAAAVDALPSGGAVAQIGAFSSAALADKGWSDVAVIMPGQMAGKSKKVEMATRDGKSFYRAFVGGFASKADADSFCASLKAAGKGCIVK